MALTAYRTWTTGEIVTAAMFNEQIRDNGNAIIQPPRARAFRNTTNQSIPDSTQTSIQLNAENYDSDGFHDNVTNNTRLTVPAGLGGLYDVKGGVAYDGNSTGRRSAVLQLNGSATMAMSQVAAAFGGPTRVTVATDYVLAAGDIIELQGFQSSGAALNVRFSDWETWLSLRRVST